MSVCTTRLRKEYRDLQRKPVENIRAAPKETNILEWHYVIEGPKGSPYEGGLYHGTIVFPSDYPYKPPSIQMLTPNGRFKVMHFHLNSFCCF
jgi:ubiquitin-conjugating enzyme E2 J2